MLEKHTEMPIDGDPVFRHMLSGGRCFSPVLYGMAASGCTGFNAVTDDKEGI